MKPKLEGPHERREGQSFSAFVRTEARFPFNWHFHPELELTYIIRSRGVRMVGDHVEDYESGDLVFLGPNLPHTWAGHENDRAAHEAIVIQFRAEILPSLDLPEMAAVRRLLDRSSRGVHFSGATAKRIETMMHELVKSGGLMAMMGLLLTLNALAEAAGTRLLSSRQFAMRPGLKQENRFERVLRFLDRNLSEDVPLPVAAATAHMAPAAFSRFFRKMSGRTYIQFVNEMRISRACRGLIETSHSITRIAFDAGFSNLSNFNRRFLLQTGTTPSGYRQNHEPTHS